MCFSPTCAVYDAAGDVTSVYNALERLLQKSYPNMLLHESKAHLPYANISRIMLLCRHRVAQATLPTPATFLQITNYTFESSSFILLSLRMSLATILPSRVYENSNSP